MNIETNKKDFELTLDNLKNHISDMNGILHEDIIYMLDEVINSYEGWLQSDIENLLEDMEELSRRA